MSSSVTLTDAGLSTQLSIYTSKKIDGHPLWASRFLLTDKDICISVHRDFVRAGSKIIRTNTYQASVPGFMKHMNVSQQDAIKVIKESVSLAKQAIAEEEDICGKKLNVQVAGSVGPYGAYLHNGSEYTGSYCKEVTKEELIEWHRPRITALVDGGVDLLAVETIPCSIEALAVIQLLTKEFPNVKAWISFSIKNESQISNGEEFAEVANTIWEVGSKQLIAVGANCVNPIYVTPLFTALIKKNATIPFIAYPNSGEIYDGVEKKWIEKDNTRKMTDFVEEWLNLGISYIGGCCRTTSNDLQEIAKKIKNWENKIV
ncbi:homocysteine S-methyltransferase YbgG-like isoform X2 [Rhodnius prolixus]